MKLSVVIPTHNRAEILRTTLEKINAQKGVDFEVVVIDDGSHQGVGRNRGVAKATGDIIVFIDDDKFVEPGFLKAHLDFHTQHPEEEAVCLGYTTWDPALPINDYMRFLESSGWQFGYSFLKPGLVDNAEPYKFFYASNISLKRSFFQKEKFDENFKVYGWEDVELGYRLWKNYAMKLFYEPSAKSFHHHLLTEADLPKKMRAVGQSAAYFEHLHPEVQVVPKGLKSIVLRVASSPIMLSVWKAMSQNLYFKFRSWGEFMEGVKIIHQETELV